MIEYPVRWSPRAKADMVRLHAFLDKHNPAAAWRALEAIRAGARLLQSHPLSGRRIETSDADRQLTIPFAKTSYIMRYRLDAARYVFILGVHNSRENWQDNE